MDIYVFHGYSFLVARYWEKIEQTVNNTLQLSFVLNILSYYY